MPYSDKLNGYWEEGYHYYLEFRDDKLTLRRYDRVIELETTVTYDAGTHGHPRGERPPFERPYGQHDARDP